MDLNEGKKTEIYLHNTLTNTKEAFKPIKPGIVLMYNCGPTVYNYAHIGNLRSYIFADILRRMFEYNDYEVKQVVNVTDIGHLSGDGDEGEDKMTKALRREGKPMTLKAMREVADFYFEAFKRDLSDLNIELPYSFPFASDHIQEDIDLVQTLTDKGFTYSTSDGIYFDISKFPAYGKLGNIKLGDNDQSRIGVNTEKRNHRDFAVWKFNAELGYEAPFGKGFPGWHIECSAMSVKYLGPEFDIHTGGIDHIPVHHNNEIAQSVCAGYPYAHYWLHNEHYNVDGGEKMSKSKENFFDLKSLKDKNINPLALRYVFLGARYSSPVQYSEEALIGADTSIKKLRSFLHNKEISNSTGDAEKYKQDFTRLINDDLDTPKALALVWDMIKDEDVSLENRKEALLTFDKVLGLELNKSQSFEIPDNVQNLIALRETARISKDFTKSDELRAEIEGFGFDIKDTPEGQIVTPC